jgi:hypothetical protein
VATRATPGPSARNGYACVGPEDGPACGIAPIHQCDTDQDCPTDQHCHAIYDGCSPDGIGAMCGPACTATTCGAGFRCNASGACEPTPCDQGNTCPEIQQCTPSAAITSGPVWSHTDGCVDVMCNDDAGCRATEACVNGVCQTSIGTCEKPMPVS